MEMIVADVRTGALRSVFGLLLVASLLIQRRTEHKFWVSNFKFEYLANTPHINRYYTEILEK